MLIKSRIRRSKSKRVSFFLLKTKDGTGQTCHPSLLPHKINNSFEKFFLVDTPYYLNQLDIEIPTLYGAHSISSMDWRLDESFSKLSLPCSPNEFLSDPNIFLFNDNLAVIYRRSSKIKSKVSVDEFFITTLNSNKTWSPPKAFFVADKNTSSLSPSVVQTGNQIYLWYVEISASSRKFVRLTYDRGFNKILDKNECFINSTAAKSDTIWHFEVRNFNDKFVLIGSYDIHTNSLRPLRKNLFYCESFDGLVWDNSSLCPWFPEFRDYRKRYKPTLFFDEESILRIVYSTQDFFGNWHLVSRVMWLGN